MKNAIHMSIGKNTRYAHYVLANWRDIMTEKKIEVCPNCGSELGLTWCVHCGKVYCLECWWPEGEEDEAEEE